MAKGQEKGRDKGKEKGKPKVTTKEKKEKGMQVAPDCLQMAMHSV